MLHSESVKDFFRSDIPLGGREKITEKQYLTEKEKIAERGIR